MQLSDEEMKIVARLRRQQQSMIRMRWAGLLAGLINLVAGVYGFTVLVHFLDNPDPPAMLAIAIIMPVVCLLLGIGAFVTIRFLQYWNGKPETRLLLRLLEELQKDDA